MVRDYDDSTLLEVRDRATSRSIAFLRDRLCENTSERRIKDRGTTFSTKNFTIRIYGRTVTEIGEYLGIFSNDAERLSANV